MADQEERHDVATKKPEHTKPAAKPKASKPAAPKKAPSPKVGATNGHASLNGSKVTATKPKAASKPAPKKTAAKDPLPTNQVDRAEDVLDELGKKVGGFLMNASRSLRKVAAVAKEEAEDLWAEAQSIRRGDIK
jgi:hypothetical protein